MQDHFPKRSLRVLIVDDLPVVREGLRILMELAGSLEGQTIEVAGEACSGRAAIQQAREVKPDVILMDLEMPGLDGFAATQTIKGELPTVRVIILSIHNDAEAQQRARAAGADGFVTKGAEVESLLRAVVGYPEAHHSTESEGEKSWE